MFEIYARPGLLGLLGQMFVLDVRAQSRNDC
jgi:hypothetical protein